MQLKPQDLNTFEAYKKAMRAAAGQIGNNTPFCIFSDVQMPDASKKMHTLKPFLVVGAPAGTIAPMLKDLHGGKTVACNGLCSLEGGKISFVAKSGTLNYGLFKSQATVFKELLGKEILIPPPAGSAPAAKTPDPKPIGLPANGVKKPTVMSDEGNLKANIKTPFGAFVYFAYDESNSDRPNAVKEIGEYYRKTAEDFTDMNSAYKDALEGLKKLPPEKQIMEDVSKASVTASVATGPAKEAYLLYDQYRSSLSDVIKEVDRARTSVTIAVKQTNAEKLDEESEDLKKQAEEEKNTIELIFQGIKTGVHVLEACADPEKALDLIDDGLEILNKAVTTIATHDLLAKAEDCEKRAKELKKDALALQLQVARQSVTDLRDKLVNTGKLLTRAKALAKEVGDRPMNVYDREAAVKRLSFHFKDLKAVADNFAEARDLAVDVSKGSNQVRSNANMIEDLVSGQWHVPDRSNALGIMEKFKAEAAKMEAHAGTIAKDANTRIPALQKLYAAAQEGMAKAH